MQRALAHDGAMELSPQQSVVAMDIETFPPEVVLGSHIEVPCTSIVEARRSRTRGVGQALRVTVAATALLTPTMYDTLAEDTVAYEMQDDPIAANGSICFDTDAADGESIIQTVVATQTAGQGWLNPRHPSAPTHANSALNYAAGDTIANTTIVSAPDDGETCITTFAQTHIVSDVTGYVAAGAMRPANPDGSAARLLDTRKTTGVTSGNKVPDNGDICIETDAQEGEAVVATVTVTEPKSAGWVNARHPDAPRGANSTVNYAPGQTVANTTVINPDETGEVCISTMSATHIVLDVAGYLAAGTIRPANPDGSAARALDTRLANSPTNGGKLDSLMISPPPFGVCIDTNAQEGETVVATITATEPDADGWFNGRNPNASPNSNSNLNYKRGQTIANTTFITPSKTGEVCLTTHATSHAVIDVIGYISAGIVRPAKLDGSAERFVDTRQGLIGRPELQPPGQYDPCPAPDSILSWYDSGPDTHPNDIVDEYDLIKCQSGLWVYPKLVGAI